MEKKSKFRTIVSIVIGCGVGKVVDDIIEAALPVQVKLPVKILYKLGSFALSWVVADWTVDKLNKDADELSEQIETIKKKVAEAAEEEEKEVVEA